MSDREFSRRLNIEIIKDELLTREALGQKLGLTPDELTQDIYRKYAEEHQAYRWRAVAANNEIIAHGESYHNEADALNAANLLAGDDTTVYVMPMYGDDRSEKVLRFGATDRKSMEPPF
jgi:uncharacterized protein YegP (UPF0339 family)